MWDVLYEMQQPATPTAVAAGAAAPAGAKKLWGFSLRESAGAAAVVRIRDGVVGGAILATVSLTAGESDTQTFAKPVAVSHAAGPFVQVVSGAVEGAVFTS